MYGYIGTRQSKASWWRIKKSESLVASMMRKYWHAALSVHRGLIRATCRQCSNQRGWLTARLYRLSLFPHPTHVTNRFHIARGPVSNALFMNDSKKAVTRIVVAFPPASAHPTIFLMGHAEDASRKRDNEKKSRLSRIPIMKFAWATYPASSLTGPAWRSTRQYWNESSVSPSNVI